MTRITRKDKRLVRKFLKTCKPRIKGLTACSSATDFLRDRHISYYSLESWIHWLGIALVNLGVLRAPVIGSADRHPSYFELRNNWPNYSNVEWYWPADLLRWGCEEALRRHKKTI